MSSPLLPLEWIGLLYLALLWRPREDPVEKRRSNSRRASAPDFPDKNHLLRL